MAAKKKEEKPRRRAMERVDGVWQATPLPADPTELWLWCLAHDGTETVVIDEDVTAYYCGRPEEIDAYREKGKKAGSLLPLAQWAWERVPDTTRKLF